MCGSSSHFLIYSSKWNKKTIFGKCQFLIWLLSVQPFGAICPPCRSAAVPSAGMQNPLTLWDLHVYLSSPPGSLLPFAACISLTGIWKNGFQKAPLHSLHPWKFAPFHATLPKSASWCHQKTFYVLIPGAFPGYDSPSFHLVVTIANGFSSKNRLSTTHFDHSPKSLSKACYYFLQNQFDCYLGPYEQELLCWVNSDGSNEYFKK